MFVGLENGLEGLLHISELADHKVENPEEIVKVGEKIEVKVLKVDTGERKIGLSRKRVQWAETKTTSRTAASPRLRPAAPTAAAPALRRPSCVAASAATAARSSSPRRNPNVRARVLTTNNTARGLLASLLAFFSTGTPHKPKTAPPRNSMPEPIVTISAATFSDGTTLKFNEGDIVVFVGPNNAGKRPRALRNLAEQCESPENPKLVVHAAEFKLNAEAAEIERWLQAHCQVFAEPFPAYRRLDAWIEPDAIRRVVNYVATDGLGRLAEFFICYLTTEARLTAANPAASIAVTREPKTNPIHFLYVDEREEARVSGYFRKHSARTWSSTEGGG